MQQECKKSGHFLCNDAFVLVYSEINYSYYNRNSKLQEEFQNKGLSIPDNERDWEPYYSYTQKLHKIMGKPTETRILMDIDMKHARKRRRPAREEQLDLEELVDTRTPNKQSKTK